MTGRGKMTGREERGSEGLKRKRRGRGRRKEKGVRCSGESQHDFLTIVNQCST